MTGPALLPGPDVTAPLEAASSRSGLLAGPVGAVSKASVTAVPIDPFADNIGRLERYLVEVYASSGATIQASAHVAIRVARDEVDRMKAGVDQAVDDTVSAVQAGVGRTVDLSDTEYAQSAKALSAARIGSEALINGAVDVALAQLTEEAALRRQEALEDVENRASSVVDHAWTEGDQLRREADEHGRRSYQHGEETRARYRSHDEADDVREAVDELVSQVAERLRTDAEQVAGDLAAGAAEMARVWRAEVPTHLAELDAGLEVTRGELEGARASALGEIDVRCAELQAELEATRTTIEPGSRTQTAIVRSQLLAARDTAMAATDVALASFEAQVGARVVLAEQELAIVSSAQQGMISALYHEVGDLFDPVGMRQPIDVAFARGTGPFLMALEQFQRTLHVEISSAEFTFATDAVGFCKSALGAIGAELERGAAGLAAVVGGFQRALGEVTAGCLKAIAGAMGSAMASIATIAHTISSTLARGHVAGVEQLDQTVLNLRASHAGATYELPKKLEETATEAVKPWWRKALDFFVGVISGIFWAIVDVVVWVVQTLANIVWGFVWGEAAFPDAWGAGVVVFVADLVAGVLVYGDVRDLLKWGLINPVFRGQGYSWVNALMLGASLIGIIPLLGDILKAGVKQGIKSLIKRLGRELAEHLVKELGEQGAERFLKEMGEETAERLVREVGEEGFKHLLAELGEQGLIDATRQLGPELLGELAKGLGEPLLKQALDKLGGEVVKDVGTRLGAEMLSDVLTRLGSDNVKGIVERVGGAGLKDLADHLGLEALQQLAGELGGHVLGDLAASVGAVAVKELAETLTADGLTRLVTSLGSDAMKPLVETFTAKSLAALSAQLSPELVGQLSKELGPVALREISERLGGVALRELTEEVGASVVKRLADDIGVDALAELVPGLGGRASGHLVKNLSAAELKEVVVQLGAKAVADTVREVGLDVYVQMVRQGGAALARRIVLRADIGLRYGRGAIGTSAAADALADAIRGRTAVAATELRRLRHIADVQGLVAARAAAELSPIMTAAGRGNIDLFLRSTRPRFLHAYFGRAVQFAVEPFLRSMAEASGALFRPRSTVVPKEPDILLRLPSGRFAVLDWTSAALAGKAVQKYGVSVVDVIIEIIHTGA